MIFPVLLLASVVGNAQDGNDNAAAPATHEAQPLQIPDGVNSLGELSTIEQAAYGYNEASSSALSSDYSGCLCGRCGASDRKIGDCLKGLPFGPCGNLDIGGSYRLRYHNEDNIRPGGTGGGLSGLDDQFLLQQTRVWMDYKLNSTISGRVGFIDAQSFGEDFNSRSREVNRHDLYQAYMDVLLLEGEGEDSLKARVGRQEIRLGSARLMMAPGWANRRRSHDGVRLTWKQSDWTVEGFWVRPALRNSDSFSRFDSSNLEQQLYGVFSTFAGFENDKLELYWLAFDRTSDGGRYDTFGSRYYGGKDSFLYEFEGGLQFGRNPDDSDHKAGFFTGGIGRRWKDLPWSPEAWVLYDYASGADTPGNGFHTYVQRAHHYLGFMDIFGRRNLEDINARLTLKPTDKLTLLVWGHYFSLPNGNDTPYNLNMRSYAGLPAGSAGSQDLGSEVDLQATYQMNEQTQFRVGYARFWAGDFYDTTPGVLSNSDASFLYSHFSFTF